MPPRGEDIKSWDDVNFINILSKAWCILHGLPRRVSAELPGNKELSGNSVVFSRSVSIEGNETPVRGPVNQALTLRPGAILPAL